MSIFDTDRYVRVPVMSSKGKKIAVAHKRIAANTFYIIDSESDSKEPCQMLTITDDGTAVGWTSCGVCHCYFLDCKCKAGIYHTRGVAYCMYVGAHGSNDGQPVTVEQIEQMFDPDDRLASGSTVAVTSTHNDRSRAPIGHSAGISSAGSGKGTSRAEKPSESLRTPSKGMSNMSSSSVTPELSDLADVTARLSSGDLDKIATARATALRGKPIRKSNRKIKIKRKQ